MSITRWFHLRRLRQQPLRTAVAVVAVAAGVALVGAVLIARSSIEHWADEYTVGVSGSADLRIAPAADHGGLPGGLADRVASVPEVAASVPLVIARPVAVDSSGEERFVIALGVDCSIEAIVGSIGCPDAAVGLVHNGAPLVTSPTLARWLGPGGSLRTDGGVVAAGAASTLDALDSVNGGAVTVWPLPVAQAHFSRPDRLDQILVDLHPDADEDVARAAIEELVGPGAAVVAADAPLVGASGVDRLLIGLFLVSLLGLTVGWQLVYNTLLLSFEERRRELAVLGALGATPRRIARGILLEAALLGVGGGSLGSVAAVAVARPFVSSLSRETERAAGFNVETHVGSMAIVIAVAIGTCAALAAGVIPARLAARADLAGELGRRPSRDHLERRSGVITVLVAAGALGGLAVSWAGSRDGSLASWQPLAAVGGMGIAITCAFRLPGQLAPGLVQLLLRRARHRTGLLRMALAYLAGDPRRTRTVSTALGAAVGVAVTLAALVPSIEAAGRAEANGMSREAVTVSAVPLNNGSGIDAKLTADDEVKLAAIPGVAEQRAIYHAELQHPAIGYVYVVAGDGPPPDHEVHRGEEAATAFAAGQVMIGPGLARAEGLEPGDSFEVPGASGASELTVGGIWASPSGIGRSITLTPAQFDELAGARPPTAVGLVPVQGVSVDELARRARLAGLPDHISILTPDELASEIAMEYSSFAQPFRALERGMLVVAFAATASTLLLAAAQRRKEHALLAAVGMAPRRLGLLTLVETVVLAAISLLSGTLVGVLGAVSFTLASGVLTGLRFPLPSSVQSLPIVALVVVVVAVAAAGLPALRTSRVNPILVLRDE